MRDTVAMLYSKKKKEILFKKSNVLMFFRVVNHHNSKSRFDVVDDAFWIPFYQIYGLAGCAGVCL